MSAAGQTELQDLSREACLNLLLEHGLQQGLGRLAVNPGQGAPIIRPVTYRFDRPSQSVVFRTAGGSKFHALLGSVHAAFEIDAVDESSRTGWSVIIRGLAEEVTHPTEITRLQRLGLEPWAPGEKPHWMRIRAWTVSGRRIVLPEPSPPANYLG